MPWPNASRSPCPIVAGVAEPVAAGGLRGRFDGWTARLAAATPVTGTSGPLAGAARVPRERQLVADRIAARTRQVYGLSDTLAAPLTVDERIVGAIVLSHRTARSWSDTDRRLLVGAAGEASSALSRAYSLRAAEAQASTDALTGLPNRRYFDEFCGLLARRRRSGDAVGVLMVDIDKFKLLNDTYGHATGDEVLRAVGGAIVVGGPRGRRAGALRRRGVRGPAAQPEPGDRTRSRRARPGGGRRAGPVELTACPEPASRSGSPWHATPTSPSPT